MGSQDWPKAGAAASFFGFQVREKRTESRRRRREGGGTGEDEEEEEQEEGSDVRAGDRDDGRGGAVAAHEEGAVAVSAPCRDDGGGDVGDR